MLNSFDLAFLQLITIQRAEQALAEKGGPGSGHFGHAGRPGEVGGSVPSEGGERETVFHGTSADRMIKIIDEGIKSGKYRNWDESYFGGERAKRVFITHGGEDPLGLAATFARDAEKASGKPSVVIEAKIPKEYFKNNVQEDERLKGTPAKTLPEVKPEWITNVYDTEGNVATKTIDSLKLKRFEKKEETIKVYIPLSLEVLEKIVKKEQEKEE